MKSIADDLRREQRERILRLTPAERIGLATEISQRGVDYFVAGQKVSRDEAIRRIRRSRRIGRRPSGCMEE